MIAAVAHGGFEIRTMPPGPSKETRRRAESLSAWETPNIDGEEDFLAGLGVKHALLLVGKARRNRSLNCAEPVNVVAFSGR
jgi:hypothetical protein